MSLIDSLPELFVKREGLRIEFFSSYKSFPEYDKLKLLLINGKSGTILSRLASPNTAQLINEGSRGTTLLTSPLASVVMK
jgi:hypothetical protein